MTGGPDPDSFVGSAAELNGDWILDFSAMDFIDVLGVQFQSDDLPSVRHSALTVLKLDVDSDGTDDSLINLAGDFTGMRFVATPGVAAGGPYTRITLDVAEPEISIESPDPQDEGNAGSTTTYTFQVKRVGGDLSKASTIDYGVVPGSTDKDDYPGKLLPPPGQITIPADQDSATITITTSGDDDPESDETFHVVLKNADYGKIVKDTGDGIIRNDDKLPPEVSIRALDSHKQEGDSGVTPFAFEISLSAAYSEDITVNWSVYPLPPDPIYANEDDFGGLWPSGAVVVAAGDTAKTFTISVSGDTDPETNEYFHVELSKPSNARLGVAYANSLIVDDDGPPAVSLYVLDSWKDEGNSGTTNHTFRVVRSGDPTVDFSVDWRVDPNSGDVDADDFGGVWPSSSVPVVFDNPSKTFQDISVGVSGDTDIEPDEYFLVTLENATNGATILSPTAWGSIVNDDHPAGFAITAVDASKKEGNSGTTDFLFEVTRTGTLDTAESVSYGLSGHGASPADWTDFSGAVSGTLLFAEQEATKQVVISVIGDLAKEPDEGFKVSLSNPSGSNTILTADAYGTILDDDETRISIRPDSANKKEGNDPHGTSPYTSFTFTVNRTGNLDVENWVDYHTVGVGSGSRAADAGDFGGTLPWDALYFQPGESSKTISLKVVADNSPEENEGFEVVLSGSKVVPQASRAPGTILDDDKVTVSIGADPSRAEGTDVTPPIIPTLLKFPVTRSGNTDGLLTVSYTINGAGGGSLTFNPGERKHVIEIAVNPDDVDEPDETFTVELIDPGQYGLSFGNKRSVGRIRDDDDPRPVVSGDPHLVSFDGLAYDFQAAGEFVLVQGPAQSGITVQGRTVPAGDLVSSVSAVAMLIDGHRVTINPRDDVPLRVDGLAATLDPDGGTLELGSGSVSLDGSTYMLDDRGRVGLLVDVFDDRVDIRFSADPSLKGLLAGLLGNYNDDPADDLALADGTPVAQPVKFAELYGAFADAWRVTDATSLFDYRAGETTATFTDRSFPRQAVTLDMLPSELVARATVLVDEAGITDPFARDAAILDLVMTGDLSFLTSAITPVTTQQVVQVVDRPTPLPLLSVFAVENSLLEGEAGRTEFQFGVVRTGSAAGSVEIHYEVVPIGDHPVNAGDFIAGGFPTGSLTLFDGQERATIVVAVVGERIAEHHESFALKVSIGDADRAKVLLAAPLAPVVIENDDGDLPARFDVAPLTASAAEGDLESVALTFAVTRSDHLATEAAVSYEVEGNGERQAGADDFAGGSYPAGTLRFLANETRKVITITIAGDTAVEFNETFAVRLINPSNAVLGVASATGGIVNDDAPPPPDLAITAIDAHLPEGNSGATTFSFVVARTGDLSGASTVAYGVRGTGSNSAGSDDFGGTLPSGTISFAAHEASKAFTIDVSGDTTFEADERFTVALDNATNGMIVTSAVDATIENDDILPPELAIVPTSAIKTEGGSGKTAFRFTVTRNGDLSLTSTVDYAVTGSGSNPADAADFAGSLPGGTIGFAPGEASKDLNIDISGDATVEADEGFTVTLRDPSNDTLATAAAEGTILNDDAPPTLEIAAVAAANHEGNVGSTVFTLAITRTGDTSGVTTVDYFLNGTGTRPADAADFLGGVLPAGQVVFAAGSSEQRLTVEVAGDTQIEPHETFVVRLHDPVNGTLGTDSAKGTIINDDASSFRVGDAPARLPRSDAGAWERSWSHAGVSITHKANLGDANESYSNVLFASSGSGILGGGDVSGGDLGVSGQTLATSAVLQEIDGTEGLRFVLDKETNQISFQLSRFNRDDDGTGLNEAGRLQFLNAAGELVREVFFLADALSGSKQVSVTLEQGFTEAVFSAGARNGDAFVYGAYANQEGDGFGADPYTANSAVHGSEYLVDYVDFTSGSVDPFWVG